MTVPQATPVADGLNDAASELPDCTVDTRGVATIRLNRPAHHNRLEAADIDVLEDILDALASNQAVRLVLLTARGKTFCAGYDLADLGTPGGGPAVGGIDRLAPMVDRLESLPHPTVAALNGPVFGGGTDLALACDFRLGVAVCRMTMPAVRFGLHYYHGGMRRYVERLGLGAAKRLFLLGDTLDSAAMRDIGFLDEVLPTPAALAERMAALTQAILACADPAVLASMKSCLNGIASGGLDGTRADEFWAATRRSPAVGRAVAAARKSSKRTDGAESATP